MMSNSSGLESDPDFQEPSRPTPPPVPKFLVLGYPTVAAIGLILNLIIIFYLCRKLKLNKNFTPGYCIIALSLSDGLCLVHFLSTQYFSVNLETAAADDGDERRNVSRHFLDGHPLLKEFLTCKFPLFIVHFASSFSIWSLTTLSWLSFVAMHYPWLYRRKSFLRRPVAILFCVGVLNVLQQIWLPIFVIFDPILKICRESDVIGLNGGNVILVLDFIINYVVPSILIIFFSIQVIFMPNTTDVKKSIKKNRSRSDRKQLPRSPNTADDVQSRRGGRQQSIISLNDDDNATRTNSEQAAKDSNQTSPSTIIKPYQHQSPPPTSTKNLAAAPDNTNGNNQQFTATSIPVKIEITAADNTDNCDAEKQLEENRPIKAAESTAEKEHPTIKKQSSKRSSSIRMLHRFSRQIMDRLAPSGTTTTTAVARWQKQHRSLMQRGKQTRHCSHSDNTNNISMTSSMDSFNSDCSSYCYITEDEESTTTLSPPTMIDDPQHSTTTKQLEVDLVGQPCRALDSSSPNKFNDNKPDIQPMLLPTALTTTKQPGSVAATNKHKNAGGRSVSIVATAANHGNTSNLDHTAVPRDPKTNLILTASVKRRKRRQKFRSQKFEQFIVLAVVSVLFNFPFQLIRISNVIFSVGMDNTELGGLIFPYLYLMYYLQFCFNALYVGMVVYRPRSKEA